MNYVRKLSASSFSREEEAQNLYDVVQSLAVYEQYFLVNERGCEDVDWIHLVLDIVLWYAFVMVVMNL